MKARRFHPSPALPFAAAAFALRSAAGFALAYGSKGMAAVALVAAATYAFLSVRFFHPGGKAANGEPTTSVSRVFGFSAAVNLSPFILYALLSLLDSISLGSAAASPWPLLILAPAVLDMTGGAFSIFAAALSAACGVADAAGAFSEAPRPQLILPLALSLIAAAFARASGRKRRAASLRAEAEHRECGRSPASRGDEEMEIAARIQRRLLLDPPGEAYLGLRLEAITAASASVGGDFYAFIPYSPTSIDILIGDVMGKGVPAALLGAALKDAFLRASLRLLTARPRALLRPETLVTAVHDDVVRELVGIGSFATLQYARIDAAGRRMDFVDCGHTPILHFDAELALCWAIKGRDLPLGFSTDNEYERYSLPLFPGDRLLFHSDGVTETANAEGEQFGEERLANIVAANAEAEPRELVRRILNTAMYFTAREGFHDDVTCVAVSIDQSSPPILRETKEFSASLSSLSAIRNFLEERLRGEEETLAFRVLLVASELASNAVLHGVAEKAEAEDSSAEGGTGLPGPRVLRLECVRTSAWVAIRLVYHGEDFPWYRSAPPRSMESLPDGGLGGPIIAAAADSVLYASGVGHASGLGLTTGGGSASDVGHAVGVGGLRLSCAFFERKADFSETTNTGQGSSS